MTQKVPDVWMSGGGARGGEGRGREEGRRDFKNSFPSYLTFPPGWNIRAVLITGFTQDCGVKKYKIFPRNFCIFFQIWQIITHIETENVGDTFRILPACISQEGVKQWVTKICCLTDQ